jgi:hypothetical protein
VFAIYGAILEPENLKKEEFLQMPNIIKCHSKLPHFIRLATFGFQRARIVAAI